MKYYISNDYKRRTVYCIYKVDNNTIWGKVIDKTQGNGNWEKEWNQHYFETFKRNGWIKEISEIEAFIEIL